MKGQHKPILSKQEIKILGFVSQGFISKQIAETLAITMLTVQTHRRNMLRKTGFNNTQQLVGWAVREGLVK